MKNILTYAKSCNASLNEIPFNSVDALILSWLSYCTFPDKVKKASVGIGELIKYAQNKKMYAHACGKRKSKRLFNFLSRNARFEKIEFSDYTEDYDELREKQFAAICIKIAQNTYFLSFRGTDFSFTGWKEDFNMALIKPIPSQLAAAEYVRAVMLKYPDGKFYLGGHSKGGNVAVFAAANMDKTLQNRIIKVFNFDGPAFLSDIYNQKSYLDISYKIIKIIPESSLVGMIFETRKRFFVIKCRGISFLQHIPFYWVVKNNGFLQIRSRTRLSIRFERSINRWINELSVDERARIIDIIYAPLFSLAAADFNEFFKTFYIQIPTLYFRYRKLNPDDRQFFNIKLKRLNTLLKDRTR